MNIDTNWAWSTHLPLLKSLVEVAKPKVVVELGTGMHSTPIFLNSGAERMIFIDNDKAWLDKVVSSNAINNQSKFIFHDLGKEIKINTFPNELSKEKKDEITKYYVELGNTIQTYSDSPKMLFVDHFTCARAIAINTLFDKFDIIGYHDCEPAGIAWYGYYFNELLHQNYDHYLLKTSKSWTGCFVRKTVNIDNALHENIIKHIDDYRIENNIKSTSVIELVKN
jgi:hypothetical protein